MAVDLSFPNLVNAGGGLLFLLAGFTILALARDARGGRLLGWFSIAFGAHYVATNLYYYSPGDPLPGWIGILIALSMTVLALALSRERLRGAPSSARMFVGVVALLSFGLYAARVLAVLVNPEFMAAAGASSDDVIGLVVAVTVFLGDAALLVLLAAGVARFSTLPADATQERRAILLATLAFGLYIVSFIVPNMLVPASPSLPGADVSNFAGLAIAGLAVACFAPLACAAADDRRLARRGLLAFVAAGLAGVLLASAKLVLGGGAGDFGSYGIVRAIGVVLLAIAVLRYDLLGVPLPRIAVRRGTLTMVALAALIIVAQIAQNVVSPRYSLLMGGVASGIIVFAFERRRFPDASPSPVGSSAVLTYRAAVRAALDDGVMTPREEEHLAEVAHHLRLSPVDALRVRREVERELGRHE